jgi:hypothetical protein
MLANLTPNNMSFKIKVKKKFNLKIIIQFDKVRHPATKIILINLLMRLIDR